MLSVIVCTHNPRQDYLARALAALRDQTLPTNEWELLVVDNASDIHLARTIDL
jgi:glycosyltransferase involved in cell wall biosynthesis